MAHEESSSSPAKISPAVAGALAGGLLVGLTTAVASFVFIGPLRGYGFDVGDTLLVGLIGSVFGIVAGAVAGAGEADEKEHEIVMAPAKSTKLTSESKTHSMHAAPRGA